MQPSAEFPSDAPPQARVRRYAEKQLDAERRRVASRAIIAWRLQAASAMARAREAALRRRWSQEAAEGLLWMASASWRRQASAARRGRGIAAQVAARRDASRSKASGAADVGLPGRLSSGPLLLATPRHRPDRPPPGAQNDGGRSPTATTTLQLVAAAFRARRRVLVCGPLRRLLQPRLLKESPMRRCSAGDAARGPGDASVDIRRAAKGPGGRPPTSSRGRTCACSAAWELGGVSAGAPPPPEKQQQQVAPGGTLARGALGNAIDCSVALGR